MGSFTWCSSYRNKQSHFSVTDFFFSSIWWLILHHKNAVIRNLVWGERVDKAVYRVPFGAFTFHPLPPHTPLKGFRRAEEKEKERKTEGRESSGITIHENEHRNKNNCRARKEGQTLPSGKEHYLCVSSQVFAESLMTESICKQQIKTFN